MTQQSSTFSLTALAAASAVPLATVIWFVFAYDFTNPDGKPDNALIRGLPGILIFGAASAAGALLAFYLLGRLQLSLPRPSIWLAIGATFAFAAPLPFLLYYFAVFKSPSDPLPDGAIISAGFFLYSWVSLLVGAITQYFRVRPNSSFKPNPHRGSLAPGGSALTSASDTTQGGSA